MSPTLKIKDFGQIKEACLDFGDLTILVGPQATGKSIALQLLKLASDAGQVQDEMGRAPTTPSMRKLAAEVMRKSVKVHYFERETGISRDISSLDPTAEQEGGAGWGGLSEFSGRASEAVAKAVANSLPDKRGD